MRYLEYIKKEEYNEVIIGQKSAQFLQSWEWGEFQEAVGNKVIRLGFEDDNGLFFAVSLIKKNLFAGKSYLYAPRADFSLLGDKPAEISPVYSAAAEKRKRLKFVFDSIRETAKKEKAVFMRFEPVKLLKISQEKSDKPAESLPVDPASAENVINPEIRVTRTIDVQPHKTLILDLSKSEEELLKQMHPKTRYNIRLAEKKGLAVRKAGEKDFEKFWEIMEETRTRDGFRLHNKYYYQKMLFGNQGTRYKIQDTDKIQDPNPGSQINSKSRISNSEQYPISDIQYPVKSGKLIVDLFFAVYKNKVVAGNIMAFFGDTATYVHGASSNDYRNLMAPYLLQWSAIKTAKGMGYAYYDFYGIDEKKWPGVTRFKKGFGGAEVSYPGTFDMVFDRMWYNLYKAARKIRRM